MSIDNEISVKNIIFGITSILWLVGCAGMPLQSQALGIDQERSAEILAVDTTPMPPALRTRSDVLYNALVGDIAAQRGAYLIAEKHYAIAAQTSGSVGLAELATQAALFAQDYDTATVQLASWLQLNPNNIDALQIAVLLANQAGRQNEVDSYLERLIAAHTAIGNNGYLEAVHLLGKIAKSETSLMLGRRLLNKHLDNPKALFAFATLESGANNLAIAEDLVRQALRKQPAWDEAQMLLVRTLKARNDTQGARKAMEQFLLAAPRDKKLRGVYARFLLEQNAIPEAELQFEQLYKDDPQDGDSLFALGILAIQMEHRDAGAKYLESLYDMGVHQDDAAFFLAQIFEEKGQMEDALRWYAKVETDNKLDSQVRVARIYAKQGNIPKAREVLQQIRGQLGKDSPQMDLMEAEILREAKQYESALEVLNHAVDQDPNNNDLRYARALTAVHIGRLDILEQDLKLIIKQDPKHVEALNALGYTLTEQTNRHQEALGYIQRALELKPDNPAILDSMGWVEYRMGHPDKAIPYLQRALKIFNDPEIAAHLGEVLWATGDKQQARKIWKDAITKSPNSEFILKMQERYDVRF